jgi:hypothetical protein
MEKGVMLVEARPSSPDEAAGFHKWYEEAHIPEMLAIEGFASARRLETLDGSSYVTVYEIDTDVQTAKSNLAAAQASGTMAKPVGLQLDPPPSVRYLRDLPR